MNLRFADEHDAAACLAIYAQYIDTSITFETALPSEDEFAGRIRDFSNNYNGHKDLNDYLCGKRQNQTVNPPPRTIVKPRKKGLGL